MKKVTIIAVISVAISVCYYLFYAVLPYYLQKVENPSYDTLNDIGKIWNIHQTLAHAGLLYFFVALYKKQK